LASERRLLVMEMRNFFGRSFFRWCSKPLGNVLLLLALILGGCVSGSRGTATAKAKPPLNASFTGLWLAPESDKTSFELDLTQVGTAIEGYHAALVGETGQIEAALRTDPKPPSVRGRVSEEGKAVVQFQLRKSSGGGEALLSLRGDRLKWEVTSLWGEARLPKRCVLYKQSPSGY
jgi:hypothetical protein